MAEETQTHDAGTVDPDEYNPYLHNKKELKELLGIVGDAMLFSPPLYVDSILGHPWTWLPPHDRFSEFSIVSPFSVIRSMKYLIDVTVPALPIELPEWVPGGEESVFWRATEILFQTDPDNNPYSYPEEAWIFVNGIGTNDGLARINAEYLSLIFRRPITIIQNATDSILVDIAESVIGKAWRIMTEASAKAYPFLCEALLAPSKKRVVVICHSQGTIIMANVLRALVDDEFRDVLLKEGQKTKAASRKAPELKALGDLDLLQKLEIYTFANAADVMRHAPGLMTAAGHAVPYLEHFANEFDLVARTGILAPRKEKWGIKIDGDVYRQAGGWGHNLNLHYLMGIRRHLKKPEKLKNPYAPWEAGENGKGKKPRLFGYFDGEVPEPY